jgi:4-amino-4-deoxy-L-arabinose transferase-like glycosyltransferase
LVDVEIRDAKIEQFRGQLIDIGLLREARTPMVMVSVGAIGLLYLIGRVLAGPLAGLTMAALAVASPLSRTYLGQARSEPTLVFFLLLTLLLALVGARRGRDGRLPLGWALACGVALGLAIGSKYTAILSLVGLLVWGLLAAAWCAWRAGPAGGRARLRSAGVAGRGWLLAAPVAFVVCVLSNPHFYPDPPLHLWHVVETRGQIVQENQASQERQVVASPVDRARMVVGRALRHDTITGSRGVPLEAILAPFGALALLLTTVRGAVRTGRPPAEGLVLVTVATYFVGVAVGFSVSWERYFLPTLIVGTILSGVGLAAVLRTLPIVWGRLRGDAPRAADRSQAANWSGRERRFEA